MFFLTGNTPEIGRWTSTLVYMAFAKAHIPKNRVRGVSLAPASSSGHLRSFVNNTILSAGEDCRRSSQDCGFPRVAGVGLQASRPGNSPFWGGSPILRQTQMEPLNRGSVWLGFARSPANRIACPFQDVQPGLVASFVWHLRYKIWDAYGRLLFNSAPLDNVVTAIALGSEKNSELRI